MRHNSEPNARSFRIAESKMNYERLLAQLRQAQLEAAIAGRMAESAFYAAEARALREELRKTTPFAHDRRGSLHETCFRPRAMSVDGLS